MPDEEKSHADEYVVLRNSARRPVMFTVAGETIHMSPGEERAVLRSWMGGEELQHLHGAGFLVTRGTADAAVPEEEAGDVRSRKRGEVPAARSAKHKPNTRD